MVFVGRVIPADGLRVRGGPGVENTVLGVLHRDEYISLFEMTGEWWRVECRFGPGFVHGAYVAAVPAGDDGQPDPNATEETYTCVPGDTLFGIGRRFGLSFREIALLNGLVEPFTIQVGQVIRIPRSGGGLPVTPTVNLLNPFRVAGETEVTSSSLQGHHTPWLGSASCDLDVRGVSSPGVPVHFQLSGPAGTELRGVVESVGLACRSQRLADGGRTVKLAVQKRQGAGPWVDTGAWVLYAHLDPVSIGPGEVVVPGQSIGAMGPAFGPEYNSSCAQGSHVHIEASRARCVVNQQAVIRNAPVLAFDV